MDRTLKLIDSAISVALTSAIIGIVLWLLWMPASFGANPAGAAVGGSSDIQIAMRWVQPILGQAIVEDALLRQQGWGHFTAAPVLLTLVAPAVHQAYLTDRWPPASVLTVVPEADHAARAQWVMGRVIVALTRQELRDATPAEVQFQEKVNRRIIAVAREVGVNLEKDLNARLQAVLGEAIVVKALSRPQPTDQSLERPLLTV